MKYLKVIYDFNEAVKYTYKLVYLLKPENKVFYNSSTQKLPISFSIEDAELDDWIFANSTEVVVNFTGITLYSDGSITKESLSKSCPIENVLYGQKDKEIKVTLTWNLAEVTIESILHYLTALKYASFNWKSNNSVCSVSTTRGNSPYRVSLWKLRDSSDENAFTFFGADDGYNSKLDLIYAPKNTEKIIFEWNPQENESWYFGLNLVSNHRSRFFDSGWNNSGKIEYDCSSIDEPIWIGGGFRYSLVQNLVSHDAITSVKILDLNPKITIITSELETPEEELLKLLLLSTTFPSPRSNNKAIQGADILDGIFYQFYDTIGGYKKYDLKTLSEIEIGTTPDTKLHYGSMKFTNIYLYTLDGTTYNLNTPLILGTGHYIISGSSKSEVVSLMDLENNKVVKLYVFPNRYDDVIAAWDFDSNKCWIIGYEPISGYARTTFYISEYNITNLADPNDTSYTLIEEYYIDSITNNTLQDCKYLNGHIYIVTGWGKESLKGTIFDFDCSSLTIIGKIVFEDTAEFEGLAIYDDELYVTTNSSKMYKTNKIFEPVATTKQSI